MVGGGPNGLPLETLFLIACIGIEPIIRNKKIIFE
jgi:hypothetical protein